MYREKPGNNREIPGNRRKQPGERETLRCLVIEISTLFKAAGKRAGKVSRQAMLWFIVIYWLNRETGKPGNAKWPG
jgi:hypothetical protein